MNTATDLPVHSFWQTAREMYCHYTIIWLSLMAIVFGIASFVGIVALSFHWVPTHLVLLWGVGVLSEGFVTVHAMLKLDKIVQDVRESI